MVTALRMSNEVNEEFIRQYNQRLEVISKSGEFDEKKGRYYGETSLLLYIQSIIEINSYNPEALVPELKIFFLKMIIGIVEQANKTPMPARKPIDEWDSEDYA